VWQLNVNIRLDVRTGFIDPTGGMGVDEIHIPYFRIMLGMESTNQTIYPLLLSGCLSGHVNDEKFS